MNSEDKIAAMSIELATLTDRFNEHEKSEAVKFSSMIEAVNQNTESINKLANETRDVISLHRDFQGAASVGKSVQGLALWLLKWGVVGAAIVGGVTWFSKFMDF